MLERYSRPEMSAIWTEENKYQAWLEVEILADEAWAELGEIPKEDVAKIREKATFDVDRIREIEQENWEIYNSKNEAKAKSLGVDPKSDALKEFRRELINNFSVFSSPFIEERLYLSR